MEAPICRNCKVFFGCQEGLCSKCFKESKANALAQVEVSTVLSNIPKIIEEVKQAPAEVVSKPDRCFFCAKLLGPVNFKCKCQHFYCTRHRHPEEHRCDFDYKTEGIRKISEENPLIEAPKFDKI
jgi:hypothetical protein